MAGSAPLSPKVQEAVQTAAERVIANHRTAGVSMAIVEKGSISYCAALGMRDISTGEPVTAHTPFRIGSVTKLFTTVAIMQLVEAGDLRLSQSASKMLRIVPMDSTITVRHLLMHRSGIVDYFPYALSDGLIQGSTTPKKTVMNTVKRRLSAPVGATFSYSNTNFVILGMIVEHLSGGTLHDYYDESIFKPLGMGNTYAGAAVANGSVCIGYTLSLGLEPEIAGNISWYYGCGDVASTARDIATFNISLMSGALLKRSTLAKMVAEARPTGFGTPGSRYGLGITASPLGGK
jgi:D-alanyl-D-alanine carboxypeptidase